MTDEEIVKGKDPKYLTTSDARAQRLAACKSCSEKNTVAGVDICKRCDCILSFKTFFKLSPCPLDKWSIPNNELPRGE